MDALAYFLLDVIITAVAYLIVPAIFCITGYKANRSYDLKTIKRIVIINGACVWIIFIIIGAIAGETETTAAVFLWSGVAYWIMKKILLTPRVKSEEPIREKENSDYKEPIDIFHNINKKERRYKVALVVVSLLLVLSLGLNVNQAIAKDEKLLFFDRHIVFVEDDDTNLYHRYECDRFKGDCYWAYNIEQAIYLGYEPCPHCGRKFFKGFT